MAPDSGPLEGQVAVVTGAAGHLGAAISKRLAADGAAVVVNHRSGSSRQAAQEVVDQIVEGGGRALRLEADVADGPAVEAMVARARDELGRPVLLVNNAAARPAAVVPWEEDDGAVWDQILRTNVSGAFHCARAMFGDPAVEGGAIVSLSSITALLGRTGNLPYVASKASLIGLTRSLARELGPRGVRVNALVVGAIKTEDERVYGGEAEVDRMVLDAQALNRRGMPEDVAAVVSFLLSRSAGFITGQSIVVDGGWVMS